MYNYVAKRSFNAERLARFGGIYAVGVRGPSGWRWEDGERDCELFSGAVSSLVDALRTSGVKEAELRLADWQAVIETAHIDGAVEYVAVIHEVGHDVRKGILRSIRTCWGVSAGAKRAAAKGESTKAHRYGRGRTPRRERAKAAAPVTVTPSAEQILERAAEAHLAVRVLWHPEARRTSQVMGEGWRTTEGIPCRSTRPGKWYLQRGDRTSHSFHVGVPLRGEPSVHFVEMVEI